MLIFPGQFPSFPSLRCSVASFSGYDARVGENINGKSTMRLYIQVRWPCGWDFLCCAGTKSSYLAVNSHCNERKTRLPQGEMIYNRWIFHRVCLKILGETHSRGILSKQNGGQITTMEVVVAWGCWLTLTSGILLSTRKLGWAEQGGSEKSMAFQVDVNMLQPHGIFQKELRWILKPILLA